MMKRFQKFRTLVDLLRLRDSQRQVFGVESHGYRFAAATSHQLESLRGNAGC
jgi:Xaa-Pro aminopeptidase